MVKIVNIEGKNPNNFWVTWGISMKTYDINKLQKTGIHHFSKNTFLEKPQGGVKLTPRFFSVKIWTEYFQCCKIILKLKAFLFLYKTTCKEIHRYWYSPFGILHLEEIKMQKNSPAVFENIAVNGGVYVCKKNDRFIDFFLFFLSFFPWFLCS